MNALIKLFSICFMAFSIFVSCAQISKKMPGELDLMHKFLTQDDPRDCQRYHYNFSRQAPRLYYANQQDSILEVIDYIKAECGPSSDLEITKALVLAEDDKFGDSLIGSATIPQMLTYRSERDYSYYSQMWSYMYGSREPVDNSYDNFEDFRIKLAKKISSWPDVPPEAKAIGLFYSGEFDRAFEFIQSKELNGSKFRRQYDNFINKTKLQFPSRGHFAIQIGGWNPQGANRILGSHPEIGIQLGEEGKLWRTDLILNYRFLSSENAITVDSLGVLIQTDKFSSWLIGVDAGIKILDLPTISTDIFAGIGYDVIYSVDLDTDPEKSKSHGSLGASIGLRQRVFLNNRGLYVGALARYSLVDYGNPRGTDISGDAFALSFVIGWSFHETLDQFFKKLNYKGNWRS